VVLIIDPRGLLSVENTNAINRHKIYATELLKHSKSQRIKLIAISSSDNFRLVEHNYESFCIHYICKPTFNILKFASRAASLAYKKKWKVELLIVGEPWESYWCAYLFRRILRIRTKIQIQLHGDFANPLWRRINLTNRVRFFLLKFSIKNTNLFRAVTVPQSRLFVKSFGIDPIRMVVVPVPINNLRLTADISSKRPKTLGLIGRIHNDRGIYNFIKIVKSLTVVRDDFAVVIAGGGPDESKFLEEIKELLPKSKIRFLGHLSEKKLKKVWRGIGVLVSTAPAESYGRAMREALVAGVPVWATKSSGVEDLISKAGKDAVKILDLTKSNHELSKEFDQLLKSKVSLSFRKQFIKDNSTYAQLLAKSWVDLINKQTS
jgi:glycosyltransferase involved in cell wall biosynthesis